jgi:hypothetical protein
MAKTPDEIRARRRARRHALRRERLEVSPVLDPATIGDFATRKHFQQAAAYLARAARPLHKRNFQIDILPTLLECRLSPGVRLFRLSVAFGAIYQHQIKLANTTALRALAHGSSNRAEAARLALAAFGECDWNVASRAEQAAFCLGKLSRAFLERAS